MTTTTKKPAAVVTVECKDGRRSVPAVWKGRHLAVHLPPKADGPDGVSTVRGRWCVTHLATGLTASGLLETSRAKAVALARAWDATFGTLAAADQGASWPAREIWGRAVRRLRLQGDVWTPEQAAGPEQPVDSLGRLAAASTPAAVHAAVVAAVTGYEISAGDEAAEQFPARDTVPADRLRDGPDGLEMHWSGRWWLVPSLGDVEAWALDSVAETPDGRTVEPDHPESWTRILGVV